jgi:hypothetical protein
VESKRVIQPATAPILPSVQYNKAQIGKMLDATAAFYAPLLNMETVLREMVSTVVSLESDLASRGPSYLLRELDSLQLKLLDPLNKLNEAVEAFGLYAEVCQIVSDRRVRQREFFDAYNDLMAVLRQAPEGMSLPAAAIFVETRKRALDNRVSKYLKWNGRAKNKLSESRERYLQWKTID